MSSPALHVTNIGSGTVNLTGANNYSGSTVITAGELGIGSASQLANTITVGNGATLARFLPPQVRRLRKARSTSALAARMTLTWAPAQPDQPLGC